MRILMTADTIGGVWTYALDLARALRPSRVEIVLAAMGAPPTPAQLAAVERLPHLSFHFGAFQLEWMDDPWSDVAAAGRWLRGLEERYRPDIIHLNGYVHGTLPWQAPVVMVAHSCVLSWWRAVKNEAAPASWTTYQRKVAAGLQQADCVVAPTVAMLGALQQHYTVLQRTQVIHNGRRAEDFCPQQKAPFVFSAGRLWDEAKNISLLARVAGDIPWTVYLAGDSAHPVTMERGSFDRVVQLGRLDEASVTRWMSRAAIYALPARYEPFGLTALEAALSGCALVLGNIPSLGEVWGRAAYYVEPDDAGALAAALRWLIEQPVERRRMAVLARERASQYTVQRMGDSYLTLYRQLSRAVRAYGIPVLPTPAPTRPIPSSTNVSVG